MGMGRLHWDKVWRKGVEGITALEDPMFVTSKWELQDMHNLIHDLLHILCVLACV